MSDGGEAADIPIEGQQNEENNVLLHGNNIQDIQAERIDQDNDAQDADNAPHPGDHDLSAGEQVQQHHNVNQADSLQMQPKRSNFNSPTTFYCKFTCYSVHDNIKHSWCCISSL